MAYDSDMLESEKQRLFRGLLRRSRKQPMIDDTDRADIERIGFIGRLLAKLLKDT